MKDKKQTLVLGQMNLIVPSPYKLYQHFFPLKPLSLLQWSPSYTAPPIKVHPSYQAISQMHYDSKMPVNSPLNTVHPFYKAPFFIAEGVA